MSCVITHFVTTAECCYLVLSSNSSYCSFKQRIVDLLFTLSIFHQPKPKGHTLKNGTLPKRRTCVQHAKTIMSPMLTNVKKHQSKHIKTLKAKRSYPKNVQMIRKSSKMLQRSPQRGHKKLHKL